MAKASFWDKPKKDALDILGDKGKVPELPDNVDKSATDWDQAEDAARKVVADLLDKMLAMENANDACRNALKQFANKIDKDNLGLDPKSKDDAAKLAKARKILSDSLDTMLRGLDQNDKSVDESNKLLAQLAKRLE